MVLFVLLVLGLLPDASRGRSFGQMSNPYRVLGLSSDVTQEDIRKQYRKLCLQYHPDKNTHRSREQQNEAERRFKEVQSAYAVIGTPENRKAYEDQQTLFDSSSPFRSFTPSSSSSSTTATGASYDDITREALERMFRSFVKNPRGRTFYTSWSNSHFPSFASTQSSPCSRSQPYSPSSTTAQPFQYIFVKHVPISLQDLYTGKPSVGFGAPRDLWSRVTAAFRGGMGYMLLYQSLLYSLPLLRITNSWFTVLLTALFFHQQLPVVRDDKVFRATILPGYKAGTKLIFTDEYGTQFIFIVREAPHPHFYRLGDDLHYRAPIHRYNVNGDDDDDNDREPRNPTATIQITTLDGKTTIPVIVPVNVQSGDTITIKGLGWPNRRTGRNGDLIVHFIIPRYGKLYRFPFGKRQGA